MTADGRIIILRPGSVQGVPLFSLRVFTGQAPNGYTGLSAQNERFWMFSLRIYGPPPFLPATSDYIASLFRVHSYRYLTTVAYNTLSAHHYLITLAYYSLELWPFDHICRALLGAIPI